MYIIINTTIIINIIITINIMFIIIFIYSDISVFQFWMVKPHFKVKTSKTSLVLGFKYALWTNQQHQYTKKNIGETKTSQTKNYAGIIDEM
jgi:hypothetical protein